MKITFKPLANPAIEYVFTDATCSGYRLVAILTPGVGLDIAFQLVCESCVDWQKKFAPGRADPPTVTASGMPEAGVQGKLSITGSSTELVKIDLNKFVLSNSPQRIILGSRIATLLDFRFSDNGQQRITPSNFIHINGHDRTPAILASCTRALVSDGFSDRSAGLLRWGHTNTNQAPLADPYPDFIPNMEFKPVYQVLSMGNSISWRTERTDKNPTLDMLLDQMGRGRLDVELKFKFNPETDENKCEKIQLTDTNVANIVYEELWGRFAPTKAPELTIQPPTDFAHLVPSYLGTSIDRIIPSLQQNTPGPTVHEQVTIISPKNDTKWLFD